MKRQFAFRRGVDSVQWFARNEGRVPIRAGKEEHLDIVLRRFNVVTARRKSHVFHHKRTGCLKIDTIGRRELSGDSRYGLRTKQHKQHEQLAKGKSHKTS